MIKKGLKILKIIGLSLVILITAGLIVRATLNFHYGKKVESLLTRMKAEGQRLSFPDYEPACNPKQNAAVIWKGIEAMFNPNKEELGSMDNDLFDKLHERGSIPDPLLKKLEKTIAENRMILDLLREAAARPCFKYNLEWKSPAYDLELPRLVVFFRLMRMNCWDSYLETMQGRIDDGQNKWISGMRMISHFQNGPFFIIRHAGTANMRIYLFILERISAGRNLPLSTLNKYLEILDHHQIQETFKNTLKAEQASCLDAYNVMIKDSRKWKSLNLDPFVAWIIRPALKAAVLRILEKYQFTLKIGDMDDVEFHRFLSEIMKLESNSSKTSRLLREFEPSFSPYVLKELLMRTRVHLARIGLACEIYKAKHGKYPSSLSDLPLDLVKDDLKDPFSGQPFIFRPTLKGFIIYSVGPNGRDDGGRDLESWALSTMSPAKDDDVAWKTEH